MRGWIDASRVMLNGILLVRVLAREMDGTWLSVEDDQAEIARSVFTPAHFSVLKPRVESLKEKFGCKTFPSRIPEVSVRPWTRVSPAFDKFNRQNIRTPLPEVGFGSGGNLRQRLALGLNLELGSHPRLLSCLLFACTVAQVLDPVQPHTIEGIA